MPQTDIEEMLRAARVHEAVRLVAMDLVWLYESSRWSLGEVSSACGIRVDTIEALLFDYGYQPGAR